ncbi:MAG TPA: DUF885 family protein [Rhizomicrobium sp.]|nr:DUF885 family protein [Rhizomicrobium sp.]
MDRRTLLKSSAAAAVSPALGWAAPAAAAPGALDRLFDSFAQENLDLSPLTATSLGLDTGKRAGEKSRLDDTSRAGIARFKAANASQLQRLKAFPANTLSGMDRVNYDVVMYQLAAADAAGKAFDYGPATAGQPYILSQLTGNYCNTPSFLDTQHMIETKADADAYLARLSAFAAAMDQEIEVARHDIGQGVVPPDFALAKTLLQMNALRAPAADASPLTQSVARRTAKKNIAGPYAADAAKIVREKVYPALERQIALVKEMQARATHDAGIWKLPKGGDYYRASLSYWATTDMTPEAIHKLGLEVVADHTARIDAIMKSRGITGGTVGQRLLALVKDPKYLYPNTDAAKDRLIADLNAKVRAMRAMLPGYFGTLPKAAVEIRRVPKNIEASQPGGYYYPPPLDGSRPGIYWINLRDTAEVPRWRLPSLTYHESIPGHHLQISLQNEATLPLLRKMVLLSAYVEGWALYAEELAVEMGVYKDDPLGQIGQLKDSMFRGVRLVVDSGMHAMKWSREKAVRYFTDTLGDLEATAVTEVERYCVWPGQACSYMLGKLEFLKQRERARKALGAHFDIRKFHDAMLLPGAVPLSVMAGLTDRYIKGL